MPRSTPNAQYNVAAPGSMAVRLAGYQRRRMFQRFMDLMRPCEPDDILDLGVTSERSYGSSNYFEKWYPHKSRITASGLDDASFLAQEYPGLRFVKADGRALPFGDVTFDFVHSSAVIEHVGDAAQQARLIGECARVARKGFFITTPNRWFPIEFHTITPFLHWFPPATFRAIMKRIGMDFFAQESNLNLMNRASLLAAARNAGAEARFDLAVHSVSLGGWPSNLLLVGLARR